jgi:hypothetical protein
VLLGRPSSVPSVELQWGSGPHLPSSVIWEGMHGLTLPNGACFGTVAATPLVIEAAVGVCRPKRAARGARTEERVATGVFVDLELLGLRFLGHPREP